MSKLLGPADTTDEEENRMDASVNGQVIQAVYQAYAAGDITAVNSYTDDAQWIEVGKSKRSGVYRGKQEIIEHAMQLAILTDGTIATNVTDILTGGEHVGVGASPQSGTEANSI
jgi:ketosteroid isomerase-like protein